MTSSTAQQRAQADVLTSRTRSHRLAAITLALGASAALALTGCGAGQVTQTGTKVAAVTGSAIEIGDLSLRNAHVAFDGDETVYPLESADTAELIFTVANNSATQSDTLVSIESFEAQVALPEDAELEIPAGGVLEVGRSAQELAEEDSDRPVIEMSNMSADVSPGLTVPFTFTFAEAGEVTVNVPIDAGAASHRTYVPAEPLGH
ncbi:hypothetical protein [Lolliginicoccus suaedae]|uniref:hypothetical protein n=1 Tax=Lolliginicoccus suaedae TaxID=2605429 RepID=UPI0011EC6000|nr:hypothetical protein [Lolliginicoccus suaedae]